MSTERDDLNAMNGSEWPDAVGEIWESNRSRFSTAWDDLPHHDQVAIYRMFDAAREAYEAAQTRLHDMCDKPPRDITVPMYRVMLARGLRDQQKSARRDDGGVAEWVTSYSS